MPKVIGHTPPWLCRPSPGAAIFSDPSPRTPPSPPKRLTPTSPPVADYPGPKRLIAHRGTEVFTAVGNQIRWADLAKVKDSWEGEEHNHSRSHNGLVYKTLATSVYYQIRQLVISPSGHFLAICTEHTVHIAFLPDYSRLAHQDASPLKLTTRQLGPTTHVIPESPLASVTWHPLAAAAPSTDCLVTVTSEAAVRIWELDKSNKWSFERPALAIDLRKLADGVSCDQDFEPSGFGKNRGFSVDDFDMEVASACFAGQGLNDEDPWAAMTLWIAMKNGDIYALCPLLPSKWRPSDTTIPSLSTSAVSRMATIATEQVDPDERRAADQQYEWVQEIDDDEPFDNTQDIRLRPQNPSAIPRLQGPFDIFNEDDDADLDVTDLVVFPARLDEYDLLSGEDDYGPNYQRGVPFTTLVLACSDGAVDVALDLEGITGQWLPKKGRSTFSLPTPDTRQLDLVTTMTLDAKTTDAAFLTFTPDPLQRYGIFITAGSHIFSLSLDEWVTRTAAELSTDDEIDPGLKTRLDTATSSRLSNLHQVLAATDAQDVLSAPIILHHNDVGYFLLSSVSSSAIAVVFDQPHLRSSFGPSSDLAKSQMQLMRIDSNEADTAEPLPSRQIYTPPHAFYRSPEAPLMHLKSTLPPQYKRIITEGPMRLSPAILDIMTSTHRIVSRQTVELETAAAELFRRCERLREELGDQVKQMSELADRLHHLQSSDGADARPGEQTRQTPDQRLDAAKTKQSELIKRYETLRRKVGRVGTTRKDLSAKEIAWKNEIEALSSNAGLDVEAEDGEEDKIPKQEGEGTLDQRFKTVTSLQVLHFLSLADHHVSQVEGLSRDMVDASNSIQSQTPNSREDLDKSTSTTKIGGLLHRNNSTASNRSSAAKRSSLMVSGRYQREKVAEAMQMVEREGAVIDAVMGRLESLRLQV